jgi:hypothetical protein
VDLVTLERAHEGIWPSEEARRPGEIPAGDRLSNAGAPNRSPTSGCLRYWVHLKAMQRAPSPHVGKRSLSTLPERGFRGEDNALRRGHPNKAFEEVLPGCIPHLWRKGQIAPEVYPRPRHAELELPYVKELEGGCAPNQLIGVWREADMHALEPRRPSQSLGSGEQPHMATVEPIEDAEGENRTRRSVLPWRHLQR